MAREQKTRWYDWLWLIPVVAVLFLVIKCGPGLLLQAIARGWRGQ